MALRISGSSDASSVASSARSVSVSSSSASNACNSRCASCDCRSPGLIVMRFLPSFAGHVVGNKNRLQPFEGSVMTLAAGVLADVEDGGCVGDRTLLVVAENDDDLVLGCESGQS